MFKLQTRPKFPKSSSSRDFDPSSAKESKRAEVTSKEMDWVQTSVDLYQMMLTKRCAYSVVHGRTLFHDAPLTEFNQKVKKAQAVRTDFLQAQETLQNAGRDALGKLNLQPVDFGLPCPCRHAQVVFPQFDHAGH